MTSILKVSEIQDPTNSNTALTIDSSGNPTFAKNISQTDLQWWSGYHDANEAPGVGGTIVNWTKHQGNGITEASGVWTIPVAGVYIISLSVLGDAAAGGIFWHVNSTQLWRIGYSASTAYESLVGTVMYQFSANDTLHFTMETTSTNIYGDGSGNSVSSMCIYKVG